MNDYKVKMSVFNNKILSEIEKAGYAKHTVFAKFLGKDPQYFRPLITMEDRPVSKNGRFSMKAQLLLDTLMVLPEDLWTEEQLYLKLDKHYAIREVNQEDFDAAILVGVSDPIALIQEEEQLGVMRSVILTMLDDIDINGRDVQIIKERYGFDKDPQLDYSGHMKCEGYTIKGLATFRSLAKKYNLSPDRINQIEMKILRKLKNRLNLSTANNIIQNKESEHGLNQST
jgi:hypothetical protein